MWAPDMSHRGVTRRSIEKKGLSLGTDQKERKERAEVGLFVGWFICPQVSWTAKELLACGAQKP